MFTGEAARYCGVTTNTIINWIEQGKLAARRRPRKKTSYYTIEPDDFAAFLSEQKMFDILDSFRSNSCQQLLRVGEVARRLGVTGCAVYKLCHRRRIEMSITAGGPRKTGHIRISLDDFNRFCESRRSPRKTN